MDLAAQFRRAASEIHQARDRRGRRYSATARRLAVRYCRQQRQAGQSFADIAEASSVHVATLGRWLEADSEPPIPEVAEFHPVSVVAASSSTLTVALPSGLRIDGLELHQVVELAQALS